jgi:hypothetical protein
VHQAAVDGLRAHVGHRLAGDAGQVERYEERADVLPRCSEGPVRANTTTAAASRPNDSDLLPFKIQSSPSRTAARRGVPASEPACGSVSPMPTISSPPQILGTQWAAMSGAALAVTICPTNEPNTWR